MSREGLQHSLIGLRAYPLYTDLSKTPGRFRTVSSLARSVALLMVSGVIALAMLGYATGALADDPFDKVKVRTWNTKDNRDSFPEMTDPEASVSWLAERPSFAIAFSGGGTRSAAATLGQLRALKTLGWLDQARYLAANSGGTWTSVPFIYLPEQFDEARFLGPYISPTAMDDARLSAPEDKKSLAGTIYHAKVVDPDEMDRLLSSLKGDEGYANLVGEIFLSRFDLHDRKKFFSSHRQALEGILQGNPDLNLNDFYLVREGRPYLIVVGTLLSPTGERFLFEATPLYVGVRNEFEVTSGTEDKAERMLIGGGYVEPFGYDSYEPKRASPEEGRWKVRLKGKLTRKDPPTNKRYRFTLSDVIGMSSAAPHVRLADRGIKNVVFPEFRHWAIDRKRVSSDPGLRSKARELKHGDGGDIDNLALMPLLARKVENILVFINTRTAFAENANCDQITTEFLVDDLISLFRPTEKLKNNVVFADGEAQLAGICREFLARKRNGLPLVYCQKYAVKANHRQAIRADGYSPSICWSYLDRTQSWIAQISDEEAGTLVAELKNGEGKFENFPHYRTFGEQRALVIDLDRERVRALSNLTAWTLFDRAPYIADNLPGASLKVDERPADFNR